MALLGYTVGRIYMKRVLLVAAFLGLSGLAAADLPSSGSTVESIQQLMRELMRSPIP